MVLLDIFLESLLFNYFYLISKNALCYIKYNLNDIKDKTYRNIQDISYQLMYILPGYESPIREYNLLHLEQCTKVKTIKKRQGIVWELVGLSFSSKKKYEEIVDGVFPPTCDKNWPHCRLFTFPLSSTMQASMWPASLCVLLKNKTLNKKNISRIKRCSRNNVHENITCTLPPTPLRTFDEPVGGRTLAWRR